MILSGVGTTSRVGAALDAGRNAIGIQLCSERDGLALWDEGSGLMDYV